MKRTYIYVDGFNLYYRALKNTAYKWLDLKSLSQRLLQPDHSIDAIKYFTAIVSGQRDSKQPIRQKTYIRALEKYISEISVYYGQFLTHHVTMPRSDSRKYAPVIKTEEKGSDVNLAVHLLNDAWLDLYDCAIVVSNDSDLAEALRLVRQQTCKIIGIFTPVDRPSTELIKHAAFVKRIRKGVLAASQLPDPLPGTTLYKPENW